MKGPKIFISHEFFFGEASEWMYSTNRKEQLKKEEKTGSEESYMADQR